MYWIVPFSEASLSGVNAINLFFLGITHQNERETLATRNCPRQFYYFYAGSGPYWVVQFLMGKNLKDCWGLVSTQI
jgi:hypothetical protein